MSALSFSGRLSRLRLRSVAGVLVLFLLCLAGCGDRGSDAPNRPPAGSAPHDAQPRMIQPPPVVRDRLRTEPVTLRAIPESVTAPGEVALDLKQVAKITSRIEGQVEQIHVQLGDRVKEGQPLAAISSLQLDQLIEEYLVRKAQADVARSNLRRTEKLRADDIVPERKLVEDKGRYLETHAQYQHVREKLLNMGLTATELASLEQARHEENHRYTVSAPMGGTVVAQNVVRGQGVAPGLELFEVVDTSRVWVFANLPIEQARRFRVGDQGTIVPKGGQPITAPLTYIAPLADETTRTIRVRFEVTNLDGVLKPREYVDVLLTVSGSPMLAVPLAAMTSVGTQRGVFVRRENGYVFVPLETGREGGGWIEVRRGLQEQDAVVAEGVFDLKNVLLKEHIDSGE